MSAEPCLQSTRMWSSTRSTNCVRTGFAIVPGVLTADEAGSALERLWAASAKSQRRGVSAHVANLDPNDSNVRVFDLIDLDPLFAELIAHPTADAIVSGLLGRDYIVSNFTANIARPGSASMVVHSDLSAVMPEPWTAPLSVNVIWCLTDVHPDNGATLHIPGSHHYRTFAEVPPDPVAHMVPFPAAAGSLVIIYLMCAGYTTGQVLQVDGGMGLV